jgi:hypothetical protein
MTEGRRWTAALTTLVLTLLAWPAAAHLTPNSEIRLRFEPGALRAEVLIPAAEYVFATERDARSSAEVAQYLTGHTAVTAPDGRRWRATVSDLRVVEAPGGPDILATLTYTPPPGAPDRKLTLAWDAVIREADSHFALVSLHGDLARGVGDGDALLGSFTAGQRTMALDRGLAGGSDLFLGAFRLGARHILEGHDHLLFLLVLLLPAPLIAVGGHWRETRPLRDTLAGLAWIVTAFTLGHSGTLILAAAFGARLPIAPVEAAIALSVLIGAVHAMRPLFPGRERWIAFGFGLIHGLAFATVIAGFGVDVASRATAILGFNLGIEAIQLLLVALLLPALVVGSHRPEYRVVRLALGGFAALAASTWLVERLSGVETEIGAVLAQVLPPLGLVLVALSLAILAWRLVRRPVAVEIGRRPQ